MSIDWTFIAGLEGAAVTAGYVPKDLEGRVIGGAGVTIASGFDIGRRSIRELRALDFRPDTIARVAYFCEATGEEAQRLLERWPLNLTQDVVKEIDGRAREDFEKRVAERWNSRAGALPNGAPPWGRLEDRQRTVVMSVAWQYGTPWVRAPMFWNAATAGDWSGVIRELRDFGDNFPTRRCKEADYLEG